MNKRTNLQPAKLVENNSIIRLPSGKLAVWNRKHFRAIVEWNVCGQFVGGDTLVELIYSPAQLAAGFLIAQSK